MDDIRVELYDHSLKPIAEEKTTSSVAEWTESRMRELLDSVENSARAPDPEVNNQALRQFRVDSFSERLYRAVALGDSADMIKVMCELTNGELRDVMSIVVKALEERGLESIAVRVDEFDRIVLFDEQRNKGFAVAPSGSYQRVSRFYDGSYRYGIELLLDQSLKTLVDAIFREIKLQIA